MRIFRRILNFNFILIFLILSPTLSYSKTTPNSFADLAEKLMPSVVNISSTQTIKTTSNPFPFQFPPGSPFEDMFKEFNRPTERKATALGSGFIIDKKGIVVTNNHVIQGADDIIVSVNGSEYKAKVLGKDPYMDLACSSSPSSSTRPSSLAWAPVNTRPSAKLQTSSLVSSRPVATAVTNWS